MVSPTTQIKGEGPRKERLIHQDRMIRKELAKTTCILQVNCFTLIAFAASLSATAFSDDCSFLNDKQNFVLHFMS